MSRWDHEPLEPGSAFGRTHASRTFYVLFFGIAFVAVAWGVGWPEASLLRFGVVVLVLCGIFVNAVGVLMVFGEGRDP